MDKHTKRGRFIVLEGLDASGKTTLMSMLKGEFARHGLTCREEREPSDGVLGLLARAAVRGKLQLHDESLALLFAADRYEHITEDILPVLEQGVHVLCDRYLFSNMAYQALRMPMEDVLQHNKRAAETLMPDVTLFIDTAPEECAKRIHASRIGRERFDTEGARVRENYLKAFSLLAKTARVERIDGSAAPKDVLRRAWEIVEAMIG